MTQPLVTDVQVLEPKEGPHRVGSTVRVSIQAEHPEPGVALLPAHIQWPEEWGERRQSRIHERSTEGEVQVDTYRLELIPFTSGILEIPPIQLALGSTTASTEPVHVEVASNLSAEELQVASSTQPENLAVLENMTATNPAAARLDVWDTRPGWGLMSLLGVLLLGLVGYQLIKAYLARARIPAPPPPPRPAHEVALEDLAALETNNLLTEGNLNPYYTELSRIARTYLGARYQFDALERTLDELMLALTQQPRPGLQTIELQSLLAEADLVKFTKLQPSFDAAKKALHDARTIVENTRPTVDTAAPSEGAHS